MEYVKHPSYAKRSNNSVLVFFLVIVMAIVGFVVLPELDLVEIPKKYILIAIASVVVLTVAHSIYGRYVVRCPECHARLSIIDKGSNTSTAKAHCEKCDVGYDLGVSLDND